MTVNPQSFQNLPFSDELKAATFKGFGDVNQVSPITGQSVIDLKNLLKVAVHEELEVEEVNDRIYLLSKPNLMAEFQNSIVETLTALLGNFSTAVYELIPQNDSDGKQYINIAWKINFDDRLVTFTPIPEGKWLASDGSEEINLGNLSSAFGFEPQHSYLHAGVVNLNHHPLIERSLWHEARNIMREHIEKASQEAGLITMDSELTIALLSQAGVQIDEIKRVINLSDAAVLLSQLAELEQ